MNREIKFRGKSIIDGKWVYGHIITHNYCKNWAFIVEDCGMSIRNGKELIEVRPCCTEVDPKTVGQYTGLKDKNGKEIHEGDILINNDHCIEDKNGRRIGHNTFVCEYDVFRLKLRDIKDSSAISHITEINAIEVIGNIYENKHLLN